MRKNEVYSWRVSTETKAALERAARGQGKSIAQLLEQLVETWLDQTNAGSEDDETHRQRRQAAAGWLGKLHGQDPLRSQRVRENLRARPKQRRAG